MHVFHEMMSPFKNYIPGNNEDISPVEMFRPLYKMLSLLGLFPYRIRFPTNSDPTVSPISLVVHSICAVFMILSLCAVLFARVYGYYTSEEKYEIIHINYTIEMMMLITSGFFLYLCAFKNKKGYVSILTNVATTWAELKDANAHVAHPTLENIRFYVYFLVFAWMPMLVSLPFASLGTPRRTVSRIVSTIVPEVVSTAVVGFYYILVLIVICLLKNIEQHCKQLVEDSFLYNATLKTLSWMEQVYMKVIEIKEEISIAFAGPILVIVAQTCYCILRQIHYLYHWGMIDHLFDVRDLVIRALWILHILAKLYAVTFTGTMLKDQALAIGRTLHDIPIRNIDIAIYLKVQHFTTMMHYHATDISMYGFFSLDASLIFNIIASLSTYLVILVQFDR